jgi:hypothetical protein
LQFEEKKNMHNPCCSDNYTHYSCLIEVETDDITGLDRLLETEVGKSFPFGASIEIADNREVYAYTAKFLAEQGEEEPVYRSLDLENFIDVEIYAVNSCFGALIIDFIADAIGYIVSKKLNTRALVSFSNQETPFCLFNCGEREQIFLTENQAYLAQKFWQPRTKSI